MCGVAHNIIYVHSPMPNTSYLVAHISAASVGLLTSPYGTCTKTRKRESAALRPCLQHLPDQVVDELLTVARVAALDKVVADTRHAAGGVVHLKRPQEFGDLLEVGAGRV